MHDKGVVLHAHGTKPINYIQQAIFCAKHIKKFLNLPVALITSEEHISSEYFDHVIKVDPSNTTQKRNFVNQDTSEEVIWDNHSRVHSYDLTPFKETIVMDTDLIVGNSNLLKCFDSKEDFLINNESIYINKNHRNDLKIKYMTNFISMYWATVFYFKKTPVTKNLFDLIKHVKQNYQCYRFAYDIVETKYRNDYAFTIAIHMLNNFEIKPNNKQLPINLFYVTDKDKVLKFSNNTWHFALPKNDNTYYRCNIADANMHVMNKFDLDRIIHENN